MNDIYQRLSAMGAKVHRLLGSLEDYKDRAGSAYQASTVQSGAIGRPAYDITGAQIQYFVNQGYTWSKIAQSLGT